MKVTRQVQYLLITVNDVGETLHLPQWMLMTATAFASPIAQLQGTDATVTARNGSGAPQQLLLT